MITKVISIGSEMANIEFSRTEIGNLRVEVEHLNPRNSQEPHIVELSEDDLFSLIGQLLRLQSEIRGDRK